MTVINKRKTVFSLSYTTRTTKASAVPAICFFPLFLPPTSKVYLPTLKSDTDDAMLSYSVF